MARSFLIVVVAKTWRLPGGLSVFISSVALVKVRTLHVLQSRQSDTKEDVLQDIGHLFSFSAGLVCTRFTATVWMPSCWMYEKQMMGPAAALLLYVVELPESALLTNSWKAARALVVWKAGIYRKPAQILVVGKLRAVTRVTMPKLLEPPLRARQRSGLFDADAVVMEPSAMTSS